MSKKNPTKYIFVTGGVASSLGKGIIAASLAKLLQSRGYRVTNQKLDPYINVDPGTLNPYEHGECYVTDDGAETDLDLGHYERFTAIPTSQANSVTTGRIYQAVIDRERKGDYNGKTVQVIPHITDEIKRRIQILGKGGDFDIVITEIGGTVGDIEGLPYIEAVRQLRYDLGPQNTAVVHLTFIPFLAASGELKTKPTQHSVKMLLENGLQPDILVLRTEHHINEDVRRKVALFCNVEPGAVMESIDVPTIYEVPLKMHEQHLDAVALRKLGLSAEQKPADLKLWRQFVEKVKNPQKTVDIALVGKYTELPDAYKSISEAFVHAGAANNVKVRLNYINAENLTADNIADALSPMGGILVAPGFGHRGLEGKMLAVKYAREKGVPFFGICLGMHCAVIEFARDVLGLADADTVENVASTPDPVIRAMEKYALPGPARLGAFDITLEPGSRMAAAYGTTAIRERHRHRYMFNPEYRRRFEEAGMHVTATTPDGKIVEAVEITAHPWFVAVQFHPEYKSNVKNPHPLFVAFVKHAIN